MSTPADLQERLRDRAKRIAANAHFTEAQVRDVLAIVRSDRGASA